MSENKVTVFGKNAEERLEILRDEKGNILLTDDQKRAVLERGRILVSASAGSGKTSTMVKRIIVMISEGATLKNLLVLVYNNAAADELKEKLHQELFKAACASSDEKRYLPQLEGVLRLERHGQYGVEAAQHEGHRRGRDRGDQQRDHGAGRDVKHQDLQHENHKRNQH
jgi:hypothetical protein